VRETLIDPGVASRLLRIQRILGLDMSIHDLIVDRNEVPIWLEIYPQGQFLFLEGLTGAPMTRHFAEFLLSRCG
jgi:hypothetical protein